MYVRDALIDNPVTTTADETFESLLSRIVDAHDPTAAVLDADGRLVGLVGIHDVLRRVVPHYLDLDQKLMEVMHEGYVLERLMRLRDLAVGDFMATTIDTVSLDDTLIKVAALCVERRRKTVPVVDAENRFVGMITRRALLEHVVAASRDAT